ncbi:PTS cellobiose transporter subunit IIC [Neobacillus cucumis]|uniref:PTS cellobiose transporter subunit IIC n=1 Tax=Neobacillus cucumis TaxID=1740721 RepID=UPI00196490A7|nr:PTS cellobiose transporter subunit IIC [Neobacillus cucumis]MBM7655659.1 PTS system cellobiose-specific IIC component [Neobacillus cucumis]
MNRFMSILENTIMPVAGKLAAQRHLQALRDGIILAMPMIIIGSIFLILGYLPIPGYADFMARTFGDQWLAKLSYPTDATFNMMGLIAAFGIAYRLAEKYNLDGITSGVISLCAFLLATPFNVPFTPEGAKTVVEVGGAIPVAYMGSKGLFVAILIGLFSTEVYRFIVKKNIVIKMPDGVPPAVSKSFVALIPGLAVILIIWVIRLIVEHFGISSIHDIVALVLGKPLGLLGGSLWGMIISILLMQILWAAGLHGANIVGGVMGPIWLAATGDNMAAYKAGHELPHIITQQFVDVFVNIGGSGATFGLVVIMLMWSKSLQMKQLGKLALPPGFFMINEPITFGMPIVMNAIMVIPFFLAPIVNAILAYVGMDLGLVAKPAGIAIPWTTPPIIGGYLATGGHISGSIMQLINMVADFLIYLPFYKMWDKQLYNQENGITSKQAG